MFYQYILCLLVILCCQLPLWSASQTDSLSLEKTLARASELAKKDISQAAQTLAPVLAQAQQLQLPGIEARAYELRAVLFMATEDYQQALNDINRAEQLAIKQGDSVMIFRLKSRRADIARNEGRFAEAVAIYQTLLQQLQSEHERANLSYSLALTLYEANSQDSAAQYILQARTGFKNNGSLSERAFAEFLAGDIAARRNVIDQAINHFQEAKQLFSRAGDAQNAATAAERAATLYILARDYKQALKELEKFVQGNDQAAIVALLRRGDIYQRTGQLRNALADYEKALEWAKQQEFQDFEYAAEVSLAQLYMRLNDNDQAFKHYSRSVSLQRGIREKERAEKEQSLKKLYSSENERARLAQELARKEQELAETRIKELQLQRFQDSVEKSTIIDRLRNDSLALRALALEKELALERLQADSSQRAAALLTVQNQLLLQNESVVAQERRLQEQRNRILADSLRLAQKSIDSLFVQQELAQRNNELASLQNQRWLLLLGMGILATAGIALFFFIRARIIERSEREVRLQKEEALRQKEMVEQQNATIEANKRFIVESEKMAALGRQSAAFSHELNTPLGVAKGAASHLKTLTQSISTNFHNNTMRRAELAEYLNDNLTGSEMILSNLERAVHLVDSVKKTAVAQHSDIVETLPLAAFFGEIVESLLPEYKKTQHRIELHIPDSLQCTTYRGAWYQILSNLIANSIHHGFRDHTNSGTISISAEQIEHGIRITYADNGRGASADVAQKIFDMFYTTAQAHGGSGIGMHIVYNLITQKMQGTIVCETAPMAGMHFVMNLPPLSLQEPLISGELS